MAQSHLRSTRESEVPRAALCRLKAIAAEQRAKDTPDPVQRQDWEELAIEWHLMANLAAPQTPGRDQNGISYYIDSLAGTMNRIAQRS